MSSTQAIRDALRANAADVTRRLVRRSYRALCRDMEETGIEGQEEPEAGEEFDDGLEGWMATAFAELIRAAYTDAPYALVPCTVNDAPSTCIALTQQRGRQLIVQPLFVAITPNLKVSGPKGSSADTG